MSSMTLCCRMCTCQVIVGCSRVAVALLNFQASIYPFWRTDIDGFELMAKIGLDMDTPVIMMSVDGDRDCVLKGVAHGAVDYLVKPIRIEEIQNIWQHVYRRRQQHKLESSMDDDREVQQGDYHKHKRNKLGCSSTSNGKPVNLDFPNYSHVNGGSEDKKSADGNTGFPDMEILEPCLKKQRIVWDKAMHRKFIDAVNQLGIEKAVPKKILEIMNISGLTRENVASHLQKYRLYLKRVEGVQVTTARPHKTHKGLKRDLSGEHAQQGSFQSAPNVLTSYQVGILPPACGAFMLPIDGSMLGPLDGAPAAVPTALNPALRSLSGESEAGKGQIMTPLPMLSDQSALAQPQGWGWAPVDAQQKSSLPKPDDAGQGPTPPLPDGHAQPEAVVSRQVQCQQPQQAHQQPPQGAMGDNALVKSEAQAQLLTDPTSQGAPPGYLAMMGMQGMPPMAGLPARYSDFFFASSMYPAYGAYNLMMGNPYMMMPGGLGSYPTQPGPGIPGLPGILPGPPGPAGLLPGYGAQPAGLPGALRPPQTGTQSACEPEPLTTNAGPPSSAEPKAQQLADSSQRLRTDGSPFVPVNLPTPGGPGGPLEQSAQGGADSQSLQQLPPQLPVSQHQQPWAGVPGMPMRGFGSFPLPLIRPEQSSLMPLQGLYPSNSFTVGQMQQQVLLQQQIQALQQTSQQLSANNIAASTAAVTSLQSPPQAAGPSLQRLNPPAITPAAAGVTSALAPPFGWQALPPQSAAASQSQHSAGGTAGLVTTNEGRQGQNGAQAAEVIRGPGVLLQQIQMQQGGFQCPQQLALNTLSAPVAPRGASDGRNVPGSVTGFDSWFQMPGSATLAEQSSSGGIVGLLYPNKKKEKRSCPKQEESQLVDDLALRTFDNFDQMEQPFDPTGMSIFDL